VLNICQQHARSGVNHPTGSRWAKVSTLALLTVVGVTALMLGGGQPTVFAASLHHANPSVSGRTPRSSRGSVGGLWMAIGDTPTAAELRAAVGRYNVVVLNAWDTGPLHLLKRLDPAITVLVYKDLSSTRSYAVHHGHDDRFLPTGVGYIEARPSWFAVDNANRRIEWTPYPHHWQMAVWDRAYQNRWIANVTQDVVAAGWDGVLADNDMSSLRGYNTALFSGTTTQRASDRLLSNGLDTLVARAGAALKAKGKLFVPNFSDGRLHLARWSRAASFGGAMDENFAHWGTDPAGGFVTDWPNTGWAAQTSELTAPLSLLVTRAAPGDMSALRYGLASAMVRAQGRVAWTGDTDGDYSTPNWSGLSADLGPPSAPGKRRASGAWTRPFARGLVIVNPTSQDNKTHLAGRYCDQRGTVWPHYLALRAHDALLLRRC
jgi:hypothetical protein